MRPTVRRIAAASAAAYLLAGWLAAALHSHGHPHAGHQDAEAVCTTCSCGHDHGPKKPGPQKMHAGHDHGSPGCPDGGCPGGDCPDGEHHNCFVCDFLAKPPVAAATVTLDEGSEPAVEAAEPLAPAYEPATSLASRNRGPPAA